LQAKGNAAFAAGNHEEAIKHFTEGIAVDPSNHVLYSNRSASYVSARPGDLYHVTDGSCTRLLPVSGLYNLLITCVLCRPLCRNTTKH